MTEKQFKRWTGHDMSKEEKAAILKNKACAENIEVLKDFFLPKVQPIKMEWVINLAREKNVFDRERYVEDLIEHELNWGAY